MTPAIAASAAALSKWIIFHHKMSITTMLALTFSFSTTALSFQLSTRGNHSPPPVFNINPVTPIISVRNNRLRMASDSPRSASDFLEELNGDNGQLISSETSAITAPSLSRASPSISVSEEARSMLKLELNEVGPEGMPMSPMMTFQKYLTMQEKRVKVSIRYSESAGLRPFYLTVANHIKSAHPDVLLEKRVLPPVGSDAGGDEAIFEVVVDGKTVVGKKKTKLLKVRSSSSSSSSGKGGEGKSEEESGMKSGGKGGSGEMNPPDIAGGRSIFVSMDKLEQELNKARKRRRPSTSYERRDALRGAAGMALVGGIGGDVVGGMGGVVEGVLQGGSLVDWGGSSGGGEGLSNLQSSGMTEAVLRLEKLKALSNRKREGSS